MADKCACCGIEFSASVKRNHIKGYQLCDTCKKRLDTNNVVESIEKMQVERLQKEKEEQERLEQLKKEEEAKRKKTT